MSRLLVAIWIATAITTLILLVESPQFHRNLAKQAAASETPPPVKAP